MRNRKVPNFKKYSKEHFERTNLYVERTLESLNTEMAQEAIRLLAMFDPLAFDEFSFDNYPNLKPMIDDLRSRYSSSLHLSISTGVKSEWNVSSKVQDLFIKGVVSRIKLPTAVDFEALRRHREDALQAFLRRRTGGLNLSQRVWSLSGDYIENLETSIATAVSQGKSAIELSQQITKYLKDSEQLKQDYHAKFGKYPNIKDCDYRASRLARTEINMAYRNAEHTTRIELDFVLGFEVKRSDRYFDCVVCESLAGKYPKEFKYNGWHPNCRCYTIAIMPTDEEFFAEATSSVNEVKGIPQKAKEWAISNNERIRKSLVKGTAPYFIKDNAAFFGLSYRPISR